MEKFCHACGMPLVKKEDHALGNEKSPFCLYCTDENGAPKSCEEIFEGGVQFFLEKLGGDRKLAEKIVRTNMNQLPHWKGNDCAILQGETATEQEFAEVMKKLE
jgi:hypothetical protein